VELPAPDVRAAEAFRRSVATALTHRGPRLAADGYALIDVVREPRSGLRPSRRTRRVLTVSAGAVVYVVLLCLLALEGRLHGERAGLLVFPGGPAGWIGGTLLWRMGRRVHALWLLRGRGVGVGVAGTVTGRAGTGKGSLWHHSRLTFTTVEGRRPVTDAVSVVSVRAREPGAAVGARAELVYDPERPSRASRPLTAGFALRTLLVAGLGALLTAAFLAGVLAALPR
jgi:hypothetical protein